MPIRFYFENIDRVNFNQSIKRTWISSCIDKYNYKVGEISYIFCSDEYLLDINKKFLNHNYFTDIITFNNCIGNIINTDIYISIDRVEDNSVNYGVAFFEELNRVMIHGVLHLVGFNDHSDKEKEQMRKQENICLKLFYEPKK